MPHALEVESNHSGREHVMSLLREKFWIPQARPVINKVLRQCITCKRVRGKPKSQCMASLPPVRVRSVSAFIDVGIDCIDPSW